MSVETFGRGDLRAALKKVDDVELERLADFGFPFNIELLERRGLLGGDGTWTLTGYDAGSKSWNYCFTPKFPVKSLMLSGILIDAPEDKS